MHYQTRNLMPYAISRTTMNEITLVFSDKVFQDDGSFIRENETFLEYPARVIDLQPLEIERLREEGITLHSGINISVVGELATVPDYAIFEGDEVYRVIKMTPKQGVTIMLADMLPGEI